MLYVLYGKDGYSLSQFIEERKAELGPADMLKLNTVTLDARGLTSNELRDHCHAVPFLAQHRLIIVEGLLGLFEQKKERQQNQSDGRTKKIAREWENLETIIGKMPASSILVLVDEEVKSTNSLLKRLARLTEGRSSEIVVKTFPLLKITALRQWIKDRVVSESTSISDAAVAKLISSIGNNLWNMNNEINKLVLYTRGRSIEEMDVIALTDYDKEENIFILVDNIIEGNTTGAQRILHQMYQSGSATSYIITMLIRQLRFLATACELDPGLSKWQLQTVLGLSGYPLDKTIKQARSYDFERIKKSYSEVVKTDMGIKSGEYSDDQLSLELMISTLSTIK